MASCTPSANCVTAGYQRAGGKGVSGIYSPLPVRLTKLLLLIVSVTILTTLFRHSDPSDQEVETSSPFYCYLNDSPSFICSHHPAYTSVHGYFNRSFSANAFVSACFLPGP